MVASRRRNSLLDSGIEITSKKVKIGNSVYQFRNVTGFSVTKLPENRLFLILSAVLIPIGLLVFLVALYDGSLGYSFPVLGIPVFLFICGIPAALCAWLHFSIMKVEYALILQLNSGKEEIFISSDHGFLQKAINEITTFIEQGAEGGVFINKLDSSVRTINVGGNLTGVANVGDGSNISN